MKQQDLEWAEEAVHRLVLKSTGKALEAMNGLQWLQEIGALPKNEGERFPGLDDQSRRS